MSKTQSKKQPKEKEIDPLKLPCNKINCEWRYSIHCPKCEWNKDGKAKVY